MMPAGIIRWCEVHDPAIENVTGSNTAADVIYGDANANSLLGLGGNDFLEGGAGADTLNGGDGWDTVRYTRSASGVTVNLTTNVNTGGDAASDTLSNTEAVTGSKSDHTTLAHWSLALLRRIGVLGLSSVRISCGLM